MATESAAQLLSIPRPFERWRETLVAESTAMRDLFALTERIAPTSLAIVIQGETGTGKDIVARLIHGQSRRKGRLVAFNCAAVPTTLAESELFGHVRGAFTGAETTRPGLFVEADGGTLFLDEAGELDLGIQAKVLRVIEDGIVRPVGGSSTTAVNVRLVAASHRDLAEMVDEGRFRADLYHRIAGVVVTVPPLRERREDIAPLTRVFLEEAATTGTPHLALDSWEWLKVQSWPGNVRELRQAVHRAVALGGEKLTVDDFTRLAPRRRAVEHPIDEWLLGKSWQELETEIIRWALGRHGNVRAAARALGRAPSTLADRVKHLGLEMPRAR